jgi:hypothetical protein
LKFCDDQYMVGLKVEKDKESFEHSRVQHVGSSLKWQLFWRLFLDASIRILADTTIMLTEYYGFLCILRQMFGFYLNMAINYLLQWIQRGTKYFTITVKWY